jgi:hypothetical protein
VLRTFLTAGLALGGLIGAGVLAVRAPEAYLFAIAVNLVTFLWCALLTGSLEVPSSPASGLQRTAG